VYNDTIKRSLCILTKPLHTRKKVLQTLDLQVLDTHTGKLRCIGCLKLQVSFRKIATNYRALWRKIAYVDKASRATLPPCIAGVVGEEDEEEESGWRCIDICSCVHTYIHVITYILQIHEYTCAHAGIVKR